MPEAEVMYVCRRVDGTPVGDTWAHFVVSGPNDWSQANDEAVEWSDPAEYEIVRFVGEVVARKTLPTCDTHGCDEPAAHWGLCETHAREDDPEYFEETDRG